MLRTLATTSLLASVAVAQVSSPLQIAQLALRFLSPDCREIVSQLTNASNPVYECLQIESLVPALTTTDSIIPPVDDYLSAVCYNNPCNSTLVNSTANAVIEGCSTDLANFGIDNGTISLIFGMYPLARDVVCLKNNETEVMMNATIPLNSTSYNSTNGTFCLTELATNITGYLGVNLTNSYVDTLVLGGNYTALQAFSKIPATALCSDCLFAAVDMIEQQYPLAGDLVVDKAANLTINGFLNNTCSVVGLNVTSNGTLPDGIIDSALNGTDTTTTYPSLTAVPFGLGASSAVANATSASATGSIASVTAMASGAAASVIGQLTSAALPATSAPAAAVSSAAQVLAGRMAEKKRWIGQQ